MILKSYGYDIEGGEFEYEVDINLSKLKTKIEIDMKVATKVPIADDYWYDTYGIPKPDNYDELRKKMDEKASLNHMQQTKPGGEIPDEKKDSEKQDLADFVKPRLLDNFFIKLADFFDQARH